MVGGSKGTQRVSVFAAGADGAVLVAARLGHALATVVALQLWARGCPVSQLATLFARRRLRAVLGVMPALIAVAADLLGALACPVTKQPAAHALVARARLPPPA